MDYMEQSTAAVMPPQEHFSLGHLMTVVGTIALLLFFTWVKNPQVFSFRAAQPAVSANDPSVPHYYAYVAPAEDQAPLVAGASTDPAANGPSIINEDGSISPAMDSGSVLGVSTEQVSLNLNAIVVTAQVANSPDAVRKYISDTNAIEANYINNADFAAALSSQNQNKINAQVEKIKTILAELQKVPVPQAAVDLQKNKILQYNSAITVLQNFVHADDNPELVSQALGTFLQAQDGINGELSKLETQFNLNDAPANQ